jgi:hypothetical protein
VNTANIRAALLDHPTREMLVEFINAAALPNPLIKSVVFMAIQRASDAELSRFGTLAALALQYIEQKNLTGLQELLQRAGLPGPFVDMIASYAANIPSDQ